MIPSTASRFNLRSRLRVARHRHPPLMDQFSSPTEHFAEPPHRRALRRRSARGKWCASAVQRFDDPMPPMGEHGMPPLAAGPRGAVRAQSAARGTGARAVAGAFATRRHEPSFAPMAPRADRHFNAGRTARATAQETARSRPRAGRCRTSADCRRPWPRASPSLPACRGRRVLKGMSTSSRSRQPGRYPARRVARAKPHACVRRGRRR